MFIPLIFFLIAYIWIKIDLIWFQGEVLKFVRHELRLFRFEEYLAFLFAIFNGFYCYKVIQDFERENARFSYKKVITQTIWLKRILYFAFFLCFLWAFTFAFVVFSKFNFGTDPYIPSYIGFSVLVIWLGYIGYINTRILFERQDLHTFITNKGQIIEIEYTDESSITVFESKSNDHFNKLVLWFEKDKVYLNPQLDLRMVSEYLGISPNYVSKIINSHYNHNFSEFINSYRIEETKKMLISKEFNQYTILSIALESGFNSRTAFYYSFKKQTGMSPSKYREEKLSF
jgi:AraC-like DNA-binding protein